MIMIPAKEILCIDFVVTVSKKMIAHPNLSASQQAWVDPAQLLEDEAAGSRHVKGMTG